MDAIELFFADLIIKALHKSAPNLSPDDDAKITRAVQDFIATGMDLAAVYFALRNAKSGVAK